MNTNTLTDCRELLTRQGLTVTAYQSQDGRRYRVTNFRGGRCFDGTLQQLREELAAGWLRFA
jgi:hypothetical protein